MSLDYRNKIIIPAWEITKERRKVKKLNFLGGFLSVVFMTFILSYQAIYTYVVIFGKEEKALQLILDFLESKYLIEVLIIGAIFLIFYLIFVPILDAALIKHIDSINKDEEENSIGDSLGYGTYKFFQVFEYNNLFNTFKFMSVLNAFLFLIRFIGVEYIAILAWVFLILFLLASFINVFLSYAKYEIVLAKQGVFKAIGNSAKITILNLGVTIKLYSLMFVLNMRVLFNFFIFLAFPIAIASAFTYLSSQLFLFIAIIGLSILFIIFIIFLSHMASVLEIFKVSAWYLAYQHGREKFLADDNEE